MMTMQHKQDSVCIRMSSLLLCRAPHTPLVYLSSAQSLNRVYLKSCYRFISYISTHAPARCGRRGALMFSLSGGADISLGTPPPALNISLPTGPRLSYAIN